MCTLQHLTKDCPTVIVNPKHPLSSSKADHSTAGELPGQTVSPLSKQDDEVIQAFTNLYKGLLDVAFIVIPEIDAKMYSLASVRESKSPEPYDQVIKAIDKLHDEIKSNNLSEGEVMDNLVQLFNGSVAETRKARKEIERFSIELSENERELAKMQEQERTWGPNLDKHSSIVRSSTKSTFGQTPNRRQPGGCG